MVCRLEVRSLVVLVLAACGGSAPPSSQVVSVPASTEAPEVVNDCVGLVLPDEAVQAELRRSAAPSGDVVASLPSGTLVAIGEETDGWREVRSPFEGWMFAGDVVDLCSASAVLPALKLGNRVFATLSAADAFGEGSAASIEHGVEPGPMRFSAQVATDALPARWTLVSSEGRVYCSRPAIQHLVLAGACPAGAEDYSQAFWALEFAGCDPIPEGEELFAVAGDFRTAVLQAGQPSSGDVSPFHRETVQAHYDDVDMGSLSLTTYGRLDYVSVEGESSFVLMGDVLVDVLDMTASGPTRLLADERELGFIGTSGQGGYGFYFLPSEPAPNSGRTFVRPARTCSTN